MLQDFLGVLPECGQVVGAKLLARDVISGRKGVLIRVLSTQVGNTTRLAGIQVKLEPLMTRPKIVDLEPPFGVGAIVAELTIGTVRSIPAGCSG